MQETRDLRISTKVTRCGLKTTIRALKDGLIMQKQLKDPQGAGYIVSLAQRNFSPFFSSMPPRCQNGRCRRFTTTRRFASGGSANWLFTQKTSLLMMLMMRRAVRWSRTKTNLFCPSSRFKQLFRLSFRKLPTKLLSHSRCSARPTSIEKKLLLSARFYELLPPQHHSVFEQNTVLSYMRTKTKNHC